MILYIELNMMMNPKLLCPYEWHRTAFAKPKHILRLPFVCYFSTWCHLNSVQQLNFEFVASIFTNNFASWFSFGRVFPHPLLSLHYTNSLKFSLRFTSAICNECVCVYPPARCYMAQCAHKSFEKGSQRLLRTHQRDSIIFGIIYERLTDLSPSCSTRHRKNAVWPMRAVTFRGTSKSKYGCSDIFCSMRLLSAAAWAISENEERENEKDLCIQ